MLIRIRNLRKNQDGQAIILAALGCLILAIGVLATVNLGHAIHERIKLQNNADATAYSLAALEARAFNFTAFVNRAQVSHYVTAMSWQSWLAMIWFIDMILGVLNDVTSWISVVLCACCLSVVGSAFCCGWVPIARTAHTIANRAYKSFRRYVAKPADKYIGGGLRISGKPVGLIPLCYQANKYGMYQAERLMKELVSANAILSMQNIAYANDLKVRPSVWSFVTGVLNVSEYRRAFDTSSDSGKLPNPESSNADVIKAQRVMTEEANASRYPTFLTNRSLRNVLGSIPGIGGALRRIIDFMPIYIEPTGQTKMIGYKEKCFMGCRATRRFGSGYDRSQLNRGNVLVGDEVLRFGVRIPVINRGFDRELGANFVSVWAAKNKGEHCAHSHFRIRTWICGTLYFTWPKCAGDKKNHPWEGIEPYIKFNPNSEHPDFHQPSTYSFLNKTPADLGGQAYVQKFDFTVGSHRESLDTNIGVKPLMSMEGFKGLNAWSRAMVYYHRPSFGSGESNWKEHPNFFNPFWRAKLAPLGDKLGDVLDKFHVSNRVSGLFRELITH